VTENNPAEPFEFRFSLDDRATGAGGREDLVVFVREQIRTLLGVVELTHLGQPVRIDGFRLQRDPETVEPLFPEEPSGS